MVNCQKAFLGFEIKSTLSAMIIFCLITLYNNIDGKMKLGDEYFNLNTDQTTSESTLIIGQQTFDLEVQIP